MNKCKHGFRGDCCCNCQHQVKIMCHPLNGSSKCDKIKVGRGSISEQLGWGCAAVYEDESNKGRVIFLDTEHGMCEYHTKKNS